MITKNRMLGALLGRLSRPRAVSLVAPLDRDICDTIKNLGIHPFILIRVQRPGTASPEYLVCKDQNEIGDFINTLSTRADLRPKTLLRGIEQALRSETYDAAETWFSWVQGADTDVVERLYLGLAENTHCPLYYGYPIFDCAPSGSSSDSSGRLELLSALFDAYDRTNGNNATRFALLESLAFALSRCLGARGQFSDALRFVDRAMVHHPYSIHLKAAKHALSMKIDGGALPKRLEKFVGEDNGYLKQFICPAPFERMDIAHTGDVLLCCGHWLPTSVGNFITSPINEVLNSETARRIRQSVTDGSYKYCNHLECGIMNQELLPRREELTNPRVARAVAERQYDVQEIDRMLFGLDRTCNLSCPSCRTDRIIERMSEATEKVKAVEDKLYPLLPTLKVLEINPAGELFASKASRRILELIDDERCPNLVLEIISNGTLFNETEWNRYPGIHNKVWAVRISTDAATKATFETLRRLGNYDVFLDNVRFLSGLRKAGTIGNLFFSFTYQRENFREMPDFVAFATSYGDYAQFERLQNLGAFSDAEYRRKAVHRPDHPLHADFLQVISDPAFRDPRRAIHDFDFAGHVRSASDEGRVQRAERATNRANFLKRNKPQADTISR